MLKLLAPTTVERAEDPDVTVILEMDRDVLEALKLAVQVAFDDEGALPSPYRKAAAEWWAFAVDGRETP